MNWGAAVRRYLTERRKAGYRYEHQEGPLNRLATLAEARGDVFLRVATIVECALQAGTSRRAGDWIAVFRRFAVWLAVEDARHEVPPKALMKRAANPRPSPYLLDVDQITAVLREAEAAGRAGTIDGATYYTLFGLIASTGLRKQEAAELRFRDLTPDGLVVRDSKFGKSRLVPLSPSVDRCLQSYLRRRRRVGGGSDHVFVLATGRRPAPTTLGHVFRKLLARAGIRALGDRKGPSIHSLRHSFAVRSLEQCLATEPRQVWRHAYALSVYLGHKDLYSTYWYLQATPTLLRGIAALGEQAYAKGKAS